MPKSFMPENEPGKHTLPRDEEVFEYVLAHHEGLRKENEKYFIYVGENYPHFKDHIDAQCTSRACEWIAESLGCTYEDVASILDYNTLKKLVGEEWFKF